MICFLVENGNIALTELDFLKFLTAVEIHVVVCYVVISEVSKVFGCKVLKFFKLTQEITRS